MQSKTVFIKNFKIELYSLDGKVWSSDQNELPKLAKRAKALEKALAPIILVDRWAFRPKEYNLDLLGSVIEPVEIPFSSLEKDDLIS